MPMGHSDNVREGTIELILKMLKTETNPKKIERGVKALMKYGLTQEDIEKRLSEIEDVQLEAKAINTESQGLSPTKKGYKKKHILSGAKTYYLSCNHLITARGGLFGGSYFGKRVWCDVCSQEREIISLQWL